MFTLSYEKILQVFFTALTLFRHAEVGNETKYEQNPSKADVRWMDGVWLTYLVVVWAVGALFDGGVFLLVTDLDADDGIHVEPGQLPGLDHRDANLEVLSLEAGTHRVH